jgi:arsenate reductase
MIKIYGIPNCSKIRNTIALLDRKHVKYEFVNVKKTQIGPAQLREVIAGLGIDNLFNTKGTTYRRLHLDYNKMSPEEKFEVLLREQSMIRRPLIENGGRYHVGYDEKAIQLFIE